MKMRAHRRRVLARLGHNNRIPWLIAPILARAAKIKERNDRITAQVDKLFPDLKGVYVRT
jgi:hypothetical protein